MNNIREGDQQFYNGQLDPAGGSQEAPQMPDYDFTPIENEGLRVCLEGVQNKLLKRRNPIEVGRFIELKLGEDLQMDGREVSVFLNAARRLGIVEDSRVKALTDIEVKAISKESLLGFVAIMWHAAQDAQETIRKRLKTVNLSSENEWMSFIAKARETLGEHPIASYIHDLSPESFDRQGGVGKNRTDFNRNRNGRPDRRAASQSKGTPKEVFPGRNTAVLWPSLALQPRGLDQGVLFVQSSSTKEAKRESPKPPDSLEKIPQLTEDEVDVLVGYTQDAISSLLAQLPSPTDVVENIPQLLMQVAQFVAHAHAHNLQGFQPAREDPYIALEVRRALEVCLSYFDNYPQLITTMQDVLSAVTFGIRKNPPLYWTQQ